MQGLEEGTSVRYNGVPVGKVERIAVAPDGRLVEVTVSIEQDFPVGDDLVARLDFVGITGIRVVNLRVAAPGEASPPELPFEPRHPVIPVVTSQLEKIDVGLQGLLRIIGEVHFAQLSLQAVRLLDNLNRLTDPSRVDSLSLRLERTASHADSLLDESRALARALSSLVSRVEGEAGPVAASLRALVREATVLATSLTTVTWNLDRLTGEATNALSRVEHAMDRLGEVPGRVVGTAREDRWP